MAPAVSNDAGKTWTILAPIPQSSGPLPQIDVGVFDAKTLLLGLSNADGISISHDLGKTWTKVADFRTRGTRAIHYGKHLYWTTTQGVIMTENGTDGKLLGQPLPNAK